MSGSTIVVDIGKTNAKVSLWDAHGEQIARRSRSNAPHQTAHYRALDVQGIEQWVFE